MSLDVHLLGGPRIERDGSPTRHAGRKAWGLLAYLAIEPRPTRTALIDLLFGEADDPSGGVQYRKFWVDEADGKVFCLVEADGKVFCLVEAPDAETAATVHREAHGLVADKIYLVREG